MPTVYNRGVNPVEAAGRIFPPRRQVDVDLTDEQERAVEAHRRLSVVSQDGGGEVPLARRKVDDLRDLARDRGVDDTGTKAALLARLEGS